MRSVSASRVLSYVSHIALSQITKLSVFPSHFPILHCGIGVANAPAQRMRAQRLSSLVWRHTNTPTKFQKPTATMRKDFLMADSSSSNRTGECPKRLVGAESGPRAGTTSSARAPFLAATHPLGTLPGPEDL